MMQPELTLIFIANCLPLHVMQSFSVRLITRPADVLAGMACTGLSLQPSWNTHEWKGSKSRINRPKMQLSVGCFEERYYTSKWWLIKVAREGKSYNECLFPSPKYAIVHFFGVKRVFSLPSHKVVSNNISEYKEICVESFCSPIGLVQVQFWIRRGSDSV